MFIISMFKLESCALRKTAKPPVRRFVREPALNDNQSARQHCCAMISRKNFQINLPKHTSRNISVPSESQSLKQLAILEDRNGQ